MANQLTMDKSLAIKELHAAGYSQRRIARTLGVSRGAVERHLAAEDSNRAKAQTGQAQTGSGPAPAVSSSNGQQSHCEPFRQIIIEKLELGLSAQRIFQDLVAEHGFTDRYWSVYRFVRKLSTNSELPFRRIEVEPGEELQVDFGTGAKIRLPNGRYRRTHVFRAVLSHSRKGYTEAVFRLTTENLIRVLENTFWALGGVPLKIVFDNAKCAVTKADWYDPELNPKIVDFCRHYGCAFIPTRPRMPRHKGKVERGVDYVQENALRGREFESLAEQNEHLKAWERNTADTRIHGTTKKQVRGVFDTIERDALKPLPTGRFEFYHEARRKVSRDGHVAVMRSFYSVPPEYLGAEVWVRYDSRLLRILDDRMQLIATHVVTDPGRFSTKPKHIASEKISSVERGIGYLLGKTRHLGVSATRWAEAVIEHRGVEAARVLQGLIALSRKYPSDQINAACDTAWRSGAWNYRVIKQLLARRQADVQQTMEFMETHPIIRDLSEYGEFIHQSVQGG